jgi:hypothetical protein
MPDTKGARNFPHRSPPAPSTLQTHRREPLTHKADARVQTTDPRREQAAWSVPSARRRHRIKLLRKALASPQRAAGCSVKSLGDKAWRSRLESLGVERIGVPRSHEPKIARKRRRRAPEMGSCSTKRMSSGIDDARPDAKMGWADSVWGASHHGRELLDSLLSLPGDPSNAQSPMAARLCERCK